MEGRERERPRGIQWIRTRKKKGWIEDEKGSGRICFVIPRRQGFDEGRGVRPTKALRGKVNDSNSTRYQHFALPREQTGRTHRRFSPETEQGKEGEKR